MEQTESLGSTGATTSGLLTATGAATTYDTTVTVAYAIGGKAYSKTAITGGATPTVDGNAAALTTLTANKGCAMVWCLNAAGTVSVFQGPVQSLDGSGGFVTAPEFPAIDLDTYCPFAYQVLKAGSTAGTITFGSSNWNATGFTNVIQNVHRLPKRPQTA